MRAEHAPKVPEGQRKKYALPKKAYFLTLPVEENPEEDIGNDEDHFSRKNNKIKQKHCKRKKKKGAERFLFKMHFVRPTRTKKLNKVKDYITRDRANTEFDRLSDLKPPIAFWIVCTILTNDMRTL